MASIFRRKKGRQTVHHFIRHLANCSRVSLPSPSPKMKGLPITILTFVRRRLRSCSQNFSCPQMLWEHRCTSSDGDKIGHLFLSATCSSCSSFPLVLP